MKTKLYSAIVGATLLAASGLAMAETPLTTSQMDGVTAGGSATATALAAAAGKYLAATETTTETIVQGVLLVPVQVGSIWVVGTGAESYSESFAHN